MSIEIDGTFYADNVIAVFDNRHSFFRGKDLIRENIRSKNKVTGKIASFYIDDFAKGSERRYEIVVDGVHYYGREIISYKEAFDKNNIDVNALYNKLNIINDEIREEWVNLSQEYYEILSFSNDLSHASAGYEETFKKEIKQLDDKEQSLLDKLSNDSYMKVIDAYFMYAGSRIKNLAVSEGEFGDYHYIWSTRTGIDVEFKDYLKKNAIVCFGDKPSWLAKKHVNFQKDSPTLSDFKQARIVI